MRAIFLAKLLATVAFVSVLAWFVREQGGDAEAWLAAVLATLAYVARAMLEAVDRR